MLRFSYNTRNNPNFVEFIGHSWEDGGVSVDKQGKPVSDIKGNTINTATIGKPSAVDSELLAEAYAGGTEIKEVDLFFLWLTSKVDMTASEARKVVADLGLLKK